MKILEKTFVMNADKCGPHTFTQTRREGNICCYRRNKVEDGKIHTFEVFITKVVKAGSPLPGGGKVLEDYEQYPGASSFGRTAWSTNTQGGADLLFKRILSKTADVAAEVVNEPETEETELITVARVTQKPKGEPKGERRTLKWPAGPFTQKELAAFNGIENYKEVYTDLQRALSNGTLKISKQTHEVTRGRAAKMFEAVTVASPAKAV